MHLTLVDTLCVFSLPNARFLVKTAEVARGQ